ncbi:MAG: phage terminase large subunit, partial [Oscillospiraceae bacterium]
MASKTIDKIIDVPNDKQRLFFGAENRFVAYGGSRGGGKSWAVRKKACLLCCAYEGIKILLLRRTITELRENHIRPLMQDLKGLAEYKELEKTFIFTNGSRIKFGYCDSENDVLQYQGQEYDVLFLDEATQFTFFQFKTLTACMRGANTFPKRMYLTCNPGGVGHAWVKRLFIDRQFIDGEKGEDYLFIKARVYDNKALLKTDTGYVDMLKSLPKELRRAWLEGDWNVFAGQYFS